MASADGSGLPAPRRRRRWPGALVLVALLVAGGVVFARRLDGAEPAASALVGGPAPALTGETLDGQPFDLAEWRGDVVLVNVWASWCTPCRREQPLLASTVSSLGPHGLRAVGIDVRESPEEARAFLAEYGGSAWPSVTDPRGTAAVAWGTFALPETYLVDRDGTVVAKASGELDRQWIEENVLPLLDEATP